MRRRPRLTRLDQKLTAGIVGFFLLPTLVAGAFLIVLYRRGVFEDSFALLVAVVLGFASMMTYLAALAHGLGRGLVRTVNEMHLGTELMTTVNPRHRLKVRTGDELETLADEINRLATRLAQAEEILAQQLPPRAPQARDLAVLDEADRAPTPYREEPLRRLSFTVLDTETTGLRPDAGDRIVSVAAVRVRGGVVYAAEIFESLINPGRPIPRSSVMVHGLTDADVRDAPPLEAVLPELLRFAAGTALVGHEVWFDLRFLSPVADGLGVPSLTRTHPVLDTLVLSRIVHGPFGLHSLEAVAGRLGVEVRGRHSALGDAIATANIFCRQMELLDRRGIRTLGEALAASRACRRRVPWGMIRVRTASAPE